MSSSPFFSQSITSKLGEPLQRVSADENGAGKVDRYAACYLVRGLEAIGPAANHLVELARTLRTMHLILLRGDER